MRIRLSHALSLPFSLGALLLVSSGLRAQQVRPASASILSDLRLSAGTVQQLDLPTGMGAATQSFTFAVDLNGAREIRLHAHDVRAPGFQLLEDNGTSLRAVQGTLSHTYRGVVLGSTGSDVAASIVDGRMHAWIYTDGMTWAVQPVDPAAAQQGGHVVYAVRDVDNSGTSCGNDGLDPAALPGGLLPGSTTGAGPSVSVGSAGAGSGSIGSSGPGTSAASAPVAGCEIALDCDFDFYQLHGSTMQSVQDAAAALVNAMDVIYRRDVSICYTIPTIIVRTSQVYTSGPGVGCGPAFGLIDEMRNIWQANHVGVARDTAHLLSGQGVFSGVVGCASIGVICSNPTSGFGYGVSRVTSNTFSRNVGVLAHELGHNWSATHCDSTPPCNLMCASSCAVNDSFGPSAIAQVVAHRNSRSCLGVCSGCQSEAQYTFEGAGCAGTGMGAGDSCVTNNWMPQSLGSFFTSAFELAIVGNAGGSDRSVVAAEFYCRSRSGSTLSIPVRIWERSPGGTPGALLGSTVMSVGTTTAPYTATFPQAVNLPAGTDFLIGLDNPGSDLVAPFAGSGPMSTWYARFGGGWSQQNSRRWNFRLNCVGDNASPVLSASGVPALSGSFDVNVSAARPSSIAALLWAQSSTSLDLSVLGAPGCLLYLDGVFLAQNGGTNASGEESWNVSVPNDAGLCGLTFFHQVLVVDPPANAAQIVTTRRGAMMIGN